MRTPMKVIAIVAIAAGLLVAPVAATAAPGSGGAVRRHGSCSGASVWKLKLSPSGAKIEVEFEVDQNVVGDAWRVRFVQNGSLFAKARATTTAPSGSFDVGRLAPDTAGADAFRVRAVNRSTSEVCVGRARI